MNFISYRVILGRLKAIKSMMADKTVPKRKKLLIILGLVYLFMPLDIPQNHIHRIWGEQEPKVEAERYSEMVKWELPGYSNMPRFDCTILGIGADGHVASIFSDSMNLLTDQRIYAVSHHPKTGQQRITMTGTVILKSSAILIPVIGPDKQEIMEHLVQKQGAYPASYIFSHALTATLFTDRVTE